jgi:hypothetical protein
MSSKKLDESLTKSPEKLDKNWEVFLALAGGRCKA